MSTTTIYEVEVAVAVVILFYRFTPRSSYEVRRNSLYDDISFSIITIRRTENICPSQRTINRVDGAGCKHLRLLFYLVPPRGCWVCKLLTAYSKLRPSCKKLNYPRTKGRHFLPTGDQTIFVYRDDQRWSRGCSLNSPPSFWIFWRQSTTTLLVYYVETYSWSLSSD